MSQDNIFSGLKIVLAGGSGFIGQQMCERWAAQNDIIVLTRGMNNEANNAYAPVRKLKQVQYLQWDSKHAGNWTYALEHADILINLSGKTVNCRYTEQNKREITSSRIDTVKMLGDVIHQLEHPPRLWINGASATIYRSAYDHAQDEFTGEMHDDFSVQVCKKWEAAFRSADTPRTRKVNLRMAIVLGKGSVLVPFSRLVMFGLGGRQGSGRQMFSWIHVTDLCRIVEWLHEHEEQEGVFNAAAPAPLPNASFMKQLRQTLHIPFGMPAPIWMLKIGAWFIGTETELLLKSRWVVPARLLQQGFIFRYNDAGDALRDLLGNK